MIKRSRSNRLRIVGLLRKTNAVHLLRAARIGMAARGLVSHDAGRTEAT